MQSYHDEKTGRILRIYRFSRLDIESASHRLILYSHPSIPSCKLHRSSQKQYIHCIIAKNAYTSQQDISMQYNITTNLNDGLPCRNVLCNFTPLPLPVLLQSSQESYALLGVPASSSHRFLLLLFLFLFWFWFLLLYLLVLLQFLLGIDNGIAIAGTSSSPCLLEFFRGGRYTLIRSGALAFAVPQGSRR